MKERAVLVFGVLVLLAVVVIGAGTNTPPAAIRTDAQIEKELRAALETELKVLRSMIAGLEQIQDRLDKNDGYQPSDTQLHVGPPRYSYLAKLSERREALQNELFVNRPPKTGETRRQPPPERDSVPAAH